MKQKLKLSDLKVASFVTDEAKQVKGGIELPKLSQRPLYCSITSDIDVCPRTSWC